jgi:hypothetical protein
MKIKFNLFQVLLILILTIIGYETIPFVYDAWFNPIYIKGNLNDKQEFIRFVSILVFGLIFFLWLVVFDGHKILSKKREINLTPWKSTN